MIVPENSCTESLALVLCTAPDVAVARELAEFLLNQRLAACVSLVPGIESHYEWEGERECSQEVQLLIKTLPEKWPELRDRLRERHPYDCPEILRISAEGEAAYTQWVIGGCNLLSK